MSRKESKSRVDIYAKITDRIVADLEKGVRPWVQPWRPGNTTGRITRPLRHNGLPYQGINTLLLWSEAAARAFVSPTWMTFKQSVELGGHVRKGETGSMVVYASRFTRTETDAKGEEVERGIPFLKAYTVFCADQIEGLPAHYYAAPVPVAEPVQRIEHADRFFDNTGAVVRYGGNKAYYSPVSDHVQLPAPEFFRDMASFVAIRAHETLHWTAAPHRLNRDLSRYHKDRTDRAREEMLVEFGAAMICADLGIVPELEPRPDHAAYIQSWAAVLRSDKRAIFQAAAHAQRAVNYLHELQPQAAQVVEAA
ncbi:ArdC family protein [Oryzicola mucosus]|uniref:ArdC family protein n=1 Tax=Oryzicola mucosus TaxID=2767425 RepID=A0A8J6PX50_9HYPH|nr:ArdC family protein [Oryzicola mucosus]MBD0416776.1 ArdC family protein [Oryzicola mucosus]